MVQYALGYTNKLRSDVFIQVYYTAKVYHVEPDEPLMQV